MPELRLHRFYRREEEFLDEFGSVAILAAIRNALAPDKWEPQWGCDDATRKWTKDLQQLGVLLHFAFETAAVYFDENGFVEMHVSFIAAQRTCTMKIAKRDKVLVAEKLADLCR